MVKSSTIAALALLIATALPWGGAAAACMSGQDARVMQLLEQNQVVPFPAAASRAGIPANQVAAVQLCEAGGGYVYRVKLRQGGTQEIPAN